MSNSSPAPNEYGAEQIQVLEGWSRCAAGRYVHRSTDHHGLHQLVYEVVDNSVMRRWRGRVIVSASSFTKTIA